MLVFAAREKIFYAWYKRGMGAPVKRARRERFEAVTRGEGFLEEICQRMGGGETLKEICDGLDVPQGRVMGWLMADEGRYEVFERAAKVMVMQEVLETLPRAKEAGVEEVPKARLEIDTAFRRAKYLYPEKFGEKVVHEGGGGAVVDAALVSAAGELLRLARERRPRERVIEMEKEDGAGER